jgi:hypothetical protein
MNSKRWQNYHRFVIVFILERDIVSTLAFSLKKWVESKINANPLKSEWLMSISKIWTYRWERNQTICSRLVNFFKKIHSKSRTGLRCHFMIDTLDLKIRYSIVFIHIRMVGDSHDSTCFHRLVGICQLIWPLDMNDVQYDSLRCFNCSRQCFLV